MTFITTTTDEARIDYDVDFNDLEVLQHLVEGDLSEVEVDEY